MCWHQTPSLPFLLCHHPRCCGDEDVTPVKPGIREREADTIHRCKERREKHRDGRTDGQTDRRERYLVSVCLRVAHLWNNIRNVSSLLNDWLSECMAMRSGIQPVSACRSMFCETKQKTFPQTYFLKDIRLLCVFSEVSAESGRAKYFEKPPLQKPLKTSDVFYFNLSDLLSLFI